MRGLNSVASTPTSLFVSLVRGQILAPLFSSTFEHLPTVLRIFPGPKTVLFGSFFTAGLVCSLRHGSCPLESQVSKLIQKRVIESLFASVADRLRGVNSMQATCPDEVALIGTPSRDDNRTQRVGLRAIDLEATKVPVRFR